MFLIGTDVSINNRKESDIKVSPVIADGLSPVGGF